MALTKAQITTNVVEPALKTVADFSGDIGDFSTADFQPAHISAFLASLKSNLNAQPVVDGGNTFSNMMYDADFSPSLFASWSTMNDCINYIFTNQAVAART